MENEIALVADQVEHLVDAHAGERLDVVVQVGADGALGVEEAHVGGIRGRQRRCG